MPVHAPHLKPHLGPPNQRLGGVVHVHGMAPHDARLALGGVVAVRLTARLALHEVPVASPPPRPTADSGVVVDSVSVSGVDDARRRGEGEGARGERGRGMGRDTPCRTDSCPRNPQRPRSRRRRATPPWRQTDSRAGKGAVEAFASPREIRRVEDGERTRVREPRRGERANACEGNVRGRVPGRARRRDVCLSLGGARPPRGFSNVSVRDPSETVGRIKQRGFGQRGVPVPKGASRRPARRSRSGRRTLRARW